MKNMNIKTIAIGLIGVLILLATGWGMLYGLYYFLQQLISIDPKISASIIGAMATTFVGLAAVIFSQRKAKQREIDEAHRTKKVAIYQGFMEALSSIFSAQNKNVSLPILSEQDFINYLVKYKTEIILWGSPKVINAQLEYEKVSREGEDIFLAFDNLVKAIRNDIGLSNKGLDNLQLIKLYINDPIELDKKRASSNNK